MTAYKTYKNKKTKMKFLTKTSLRAESVICQPKQLWCEPRSNQTY